MSELFASGRIVDLVLALVACEWIALATFHRISGRGVPLRAISANMMSGVLLMLALRAALVSASWGWVAACLTGALVAHVVDLAMRWRS